MSVVLLVLLGIGVVYWFHLQRPSAAAGSGDAVEDAPRVTRPSTRSADVVLIASGYIVAHHKIQLGSKVMGKVIWIGVDKGDQVARNQLLVKLDNREYQAQLDEARAAFQSAQARLAELEAGSRPQEIAQAQAEVSRIRADLENDRLELERMQSLYDSGVTSLQSVDSARVRVRTGEESLQGALQVLELLQLGPRPEQIRQARAEVERAQANVDYRKTLLEATEIRAPIAGTVLERLAELGEMVTTSLGGTGGARTAVVALADLTDLRVELDISQADFKLISEAERCRMVPEAYPDRSYPCEIAEISPEANRQKATIEVKVRVLEPDEFLRPEMSARVVFSKKPTAEEPSEAGDLIGAEVK